MSFILYACSGLVAANSALSSLNRAGGAMSESCSDGTLIGRLPPYWGFISVISVRLAIAGILRIVVFPFTFLSQGIIVGLRSDLNFLTGGGLSVW